MSSPELGMIHSVYSPTVLPNWSTNSCRESIANDSSITAYSTHLSFVSDQQRQNSYTGLSKVPCKASVARQSLKQTGRDSVASRLHGRWVIVNVSLMNQLGFIRVDRRCFDTIRVLACSPAITCWVNLSQPGGPYPWIPSLGPVNTAAITHATDARPFSLVLQLSINDWKGSAYRKVLVETDAIDHRYAGQTVSPGTNRSGCMLGNMTGC